ncbi:LutC/YkgG family protein [Streptomyces sp. HUAS TT20]|uniref:LutC/YkgG family protein n=1 Tax=Streptomyces sp. HUAS TT20 TaxID=3447509 RepID=UPI0021D9A8C2|nr:LUD domain-containing protein [Streptomyces sp. HUAS 15-9]UXY25193.1 LUD domain-containing protein [Streptomyces sp. HUAS 15-9]
MTATARETVLSRVRDALALSPGPETVVPRAYRTGRRLPDTERLALFVDRLVDYRTQVHTCTASETAAVVAEVLHAHGARKIGVPPGLDPAWLAAYDGTVLTDSADIPAPQLDLLDGVVTASTVSCAETGTIFLDAAAPDQGRRALTLVPDLHLCVIDLSSVQTGVPEAVARLRPTHPLTLISGPSATSDIELERVEGVHGPRTLEVVIRTDA